MKKYMTDFIVRHNDHIHHLYSLLTLAPADGSPLPPMMPGQFVQIAVPDAPHTFLRRPISINSVDYRTNELSLLVRKAGDGTARLISLREGAAINLLLPLGNGFSLCDDSSSRLLLVGGGVGVAPLLYLGQRLAEAGCSPRFLLGARSEADLLELDRFREIGPVSVSTDDGSAGEKGVVTCNSIWDESFDRVYCCGPAPMMKAVAAICRRTSTPCEVSLENMMACGLGACLCCVEKTVKGNVCVCTEGPVFDIEMLTW